MKKIIALTMIFLMASCGFRRLKNNLQNTLSVRDSIVYKTDTVRIAVPGGMVRVIAYDTLNIHDTIYKKDLVSGVWLRVWRDRYNKLNAECGKKPDTLSTAVRHTEKYKTIEHIKEVPVKFIPVWVWLAFGALGIVLISLFMKILIR